MASKAAYLKKYLSTGKEDGEDKKKKKRIKKRSNLAIHDDDVDWRSLILQSKPESEDEGDPDEAPLVAEFKDESVQNNTKWQPLVRDEVDLSPPRRKRYDSPDLSPPRNSNHNRHESHSDNTPPRKTNSRNNRNISTDLSLVRKTRKTSSPPRRSRVKNGSPVEFLVKQSQDNGRVHGRKRQRHDSTDNSPPRRTRHDSNDNSPPRRTRHDSNDNSPPRRTRHDSDDNSPPRRTRHELNPLQSRNKQMNTKSASRTQLSPDLSPPRKRGTVVSRSEDRMSSGARAGLQNAQALKEENALVRKKQEEHFKSMDPSMSGKHGETVYRNKQGRKIDPKLEKLLRKEKEKEMEEDNEKFMTWGKGAAQSKSHQDKLQEDLYEMSKPLARYADDEDLERMLKDRERAGDPMLAFIQKSKGGQASKKSSKKAKPTYRGAFPLNRFDLRPGYRWDGVNRSNGFEKSWFARESNKKALTDEAYKWSVEDM